MLSIQGQIKQISDLELPEAIGNVAGIVQSHC